MTTKQFIMSCIINILNAFFYFYGYEFTFNYQFLLFLTILTLDFNSIYLLLSFICDISFFIFKSTKLEALNTFLRDKFCHIFNPASYFVTILFWILAAMGGMGDIFFNARIIILNIHMHLLITIFVIIDIFFAEHQRHSFSWVYFGMIFGYIISYGIFCAILTLKFDSPPYPFLKGMPIWALIGCYAIFTIVCLLCYLLHILIFRIKYKYKCFIIEEDSLELPEKADESNKMI